MKIHNLAVVFIIIAIPLILILSYYITLQSETLRMQAEYNSKLLDSTKEAIDAFEINTVEWNANYSETADSKRRDVLASINTFTNSFANNIGLTGTTRESILRYIPAIAFTLYDGYYIYSPADSYSTIKDTNGVAVLVGQKLREAAQASPPVTPRITFNAGLATRADSGEFDGQVIYDVVPRSCSRWNIYRFR